MTMFLFGLPSQGKTACCPHPGANLMVWQSKRSTCDGGKTWMCRINLRKERTDVPTIGCSP